jgi:hypothetical protein
MLQPRPALPLSSVLSVPPGAAVAAAAPGGICGGQLENGAGCSGSCRRWAARRSSARGCRRSRSARALKTTCSALSDRRPRTSNSLAPLADRTRNMLGRRQVAGREEDLCIARRRRPRPIAVPCQVRRRWQRRAGRQDSWPTVKHLELWLRPTGTCQDRTFALRHDRTFCRRPTCRP